MIMTKQVTRRAAKPDLKDSSAPLDGPSTSQTKAGRAVPTVVLVDDHPIVREGLAKLIEDEKRFKVIGQAGNSATALQMVTALQPDLMLIDLEMPGVSGLELIKSAAAQRRATSLLVLSMHEESVYAARALRAGAKGYIMKQEAVENLVEAMIQVLRGEVYLSARMKQVVLHGIVDQPRKAEDPLEKLSDRELEVFRLIGIGLSTRDIGTRLNLSPKTIESYRENLKVKLGLTNGKDLVQLAIQHGRGLR